MARKNWDAKNELASGGKDNAAEAYEDYLLLLQQRNRLLAKLKEKDEKQLDLERREQGFSLYLNGANVGLRLDASKSKRSKTAGDPAKREVYKADLESAYARLKTAPSKVTRKGWDQNPPDAIKIKTDKGDRVKVDIPGVLTGKYSEDFEVYQSYLESKLEGSGEDDSGEGDSGEDTEEDNEEREDEHEELGYAGSESDNDSESDDDMNNMTFNVQDLKVLRASLENDSSIKKSIASVTEELPSSDSDIGEGTNSTGFGLDEIDEELSDCSLLSDTDNKKESIDVVVESTSLSSNNHNEDKVKVKELKSYSPNERRETLEMSSGSPRNRPISASRKQDINKSSPLNHAVTEDISAAIAEENKKLMEYQGKRNTKSAPTPHQRYAVLDVAERPITSSITDDEIHSITEKVRSLNGRQQKKLLKMLAEIDSKEEVAENWDKKKDKHRNYLKVEKNSREHVDSSILLEDSLNSSSFYLKETESKNLEGNLNINMHKNFTHTQLESNNFYSSPKHINRLDEMKLNETSASSNKTSSEDCLHVLLELLSNWGNEDYIGLTEIQFFDNENKQVKLLEEDLDLINDSNSEEYMKNLINSKTKTTKEKYMWKCNYCATDKIGISASLPNISSSNLAKVVIWNYNKSLQELNIGVKDCNITINGELKWQGVIEKGCGNQIFDYSTVIQLIPDSAKPPVEVDRETNLSNGISNLQHKKGFDNTHASAINKESHSVNYSSVYSKPKIFNETRVAENTSLKMDKDAERCSLKEKERKQSRGRDRDGEKTRESKQSREKDRDEEKSICKTKETTSDRSSSANGGKPLWLEDSIKRKQSKDTPDPFLLIKKISRPTSGRRSQQSTPDSSEDFSNIKTPTSDRSLQSTPDLLDDPLPVRRPISGRRSQRKFSPNKEDDTVKAKNELDDLFDIRSMPIRRTGANRKEWSLNHKKRDKTSAINPLPSNSGPLLFDMPSGDSTDTKRSEFTKFREMMDTNLEQSFQSINNFNVHHLGRITASIDADIDNDIMSFLQPMKQRDVAAVQEKSIMPEEIEIEPGISETEELFELPVLPRGKDLLLNVKTTWGDKHYVGLNGIEVFSKDGKLIKIRNIRANPADINVLPEYDGDPRVVSNLIDGCYLTRDDLHLWLTPFTPDGDHFVELEFEEEVEIAMIRIWNYNKSRIHSTRGARFIEMALDGKLIFIGEIARASGVLSNEDPYGDTILFTTDEEILSQVAANDFTYEVDASDEEDDLAMSMNFAKRPGTANKAEEAVERPFTCPKSRQHSALSTRNEVTPTNDRVLSPEDGFLQSKDRVLSPDDGFIHSEDQVRSPEDGFIHCKAITIFFSQTWEDQHYLGLTGLEVLGETFERIPLEMRMLEASPRDLNDLEEYEDDDRTLDKLINGVNVTTCDENMWLIPFDEDESHILKITFDDVMIVTGLRIWNYNKSLEDTFRGAKTIHVYCDDHYVTPENGFLLRKGPGHCHFDFAQDLLFNDPSLSTQLQLEYPESSRERKINLQKIVNEYETIMMPSGFVFQFKFFSSWGDPYYMGLNGIEVYDKVGEKINLTDNNITAFPHSVNILEGIEDDVRTPDKLVDGVYDTYDGRHMWLSPILAEQINIVYIVFDKPVAISMIKLWNYSKTPSRGVRSFGLLVDDLLVYSGILPQCGMHQRAIVPGLQLPVTHHTILFTDNEKLAMKERKHVLSSSVSYGEQNIQLTNDRAVVHPYDNNEKKSTADPSMRPMTSVTSMGKFRANER